MRLPSWFRDSAFVFALGANAVTATELISSEKLQNDITAKGLQNNLWHLNRIARENGGNRAFGLPGYEKSRDFVLERVARFSTIDSWVQPFPGWFSETYNITLDVDTFGAVNVTTFTGAAGTPDRKPLTAPLIALPVNDVNGTGCTASDYNGVAVSGKIVIVKRGICAFGIKSSLARKSGAAGVLIWNNVQTPVFGSLGQQSDYAPTGLISLTDGQAIIGKLEAGQNLQATLWIDAVSEYRESWNVIAETKGGDPDNVVVLGAHLDSVQAGPGINDDGSGTTALLELIGGVKKYQVKNKVRFIWWGAEESGLVGSNYYAAHLSEEEASKIALYLNFDMIGGDTSWGVFDGSGKAYGFTPPPGSAHIEKLFSDYLVNKNLQVTPFGFDNNTDYVGLLSLGIPVGGLHTGADDFYHSAGDDINNIGWEFLVTNSKAAAHVLATYALDLQGIPKRAERVRIPPKSLRTMMAKQPQTPRNSCGDHAHHTEL